MTDTATELHRHGLITSNELPEGAIGTAWGEPLDEYVGMLTLVVDETIERTTKIRQSRDLTANGKSRRIMELGRASHGKITSALRRASAAPNRAADQIRTRTTVRAIGLSDLSNDRTRGIASDGSEKTSPALFSAAPIRQFDEALRLHELRTQISSMEAQSALFEIESAARAGDGRVMVAVETLSKWTASKIGLDESRMNALRTQFLRTQDPRSFADLQAVEVVIQIMQGNAATARTAIEQLTGIGGDPAHDITATEVADAIDRATGTK